MRFTVYAEEIYFLESLRVCSIGSQVFLFVIRAPVCVIKKCQIDRNYYRESDLIVSKVLMIFRNSTSPKLTIEVPGVCVCV